MSVHQRIDLRQDKQALQRLTEAAEKAKIELSSASQSEINLPFITATPEGPKHLDLTLTRAKFEELASKLIDRCRVPVEQALKDAKLSSAELDEIVMVGGSTRMPQVQRAVGEFFGRAASRFGAHFGEPRADVGTPVDFHHLAVELGDDGRLLFESLNSLRCGASVLDTVFASTAALLACSSACFLVASA